MQKNAATCLVNFLEPDVSKFLMYLVQPQPTPTSISRLILILMISVLTVGCGKSPENNSDKPEKDSLNGKKVPAAGIEVLDWPDHIEPTHVAMELKKVSQHTYFVEGPPGTPTDNEGFMSNAGVVVTPDGVVVFDALGTPSLAFKLCKLIKEITDKPIVKVVVSHFHADHIYGLQVLKDMGAEVIAPIGAKDYLASDAAQGRLKERRESLFPWVNEETYIVDPDVYVDKDVSFTLGGINFEIILLGSTHSQGDLMLRVKPDGVLFSGDLVFEGRIPFVAGSNPDVWLDRLSKFDASGIRYVVPGHGSMSTNPEQALGFTRDYLVYLHDSMSNAVENLVSFDEAYSSLDWSKYENLPAFVANRVNAYYVYLKLEELSIQ